MQQPLIYSQEYLEAIVNICFLIKAIGKEGTGPNSLTGQCNAMGSRLYSAETCLFAGRKFNLEEDRKKIANILEIKDDLIPNRPTLAFNEIIEKVETKDIRGLWIIADRKSTRLNSSHRSLLRMPSSA